MLLCVYIYPLSLHIYMNIPPCVFIYSVINIYIYICMYIVSTLLMLLLLCATLHCADLCFAFLSLPDFSSALVSFRGSSYELHAELLVIRSSRQYTIGIMYIYIYIYTEYIFRYVAEKYRQI